MRQVKNVALVLLSVHFCLYVYSIIKQTKRLYHTNILKEEVEKLFNVTVIYFFSRDSVLYALVYDPVSFAYYEMEVARNAERENNPFDNFIDGMEF